MVNGDRDVKSLGVIASGQSFSCAAKMETEGWRKRERANISGKRVCFIHGGAPGEWVRMRQIKALTGGKHMEYAAMPACSCAAWQGKVTGARRLKPLLPFFMPGEEKKNPLEKGGIAHHIEPALNGYYWRG